MKRIRQEKLLELISKYEIDTQDELIERLRESGFEVTQATVSRDIKELRLVKTMVSDGKYRYSPASSDSNSDVCRYKRGRIVYSVTDHNGNALLLQKPYFSFFIGW